jgi:LmbE family N-acetylglucosaminyl deacetylase
MYGKRILILIPHPDDEVVGCCAAIGRAVERGAEVYGLYLTTGVPAREVLWPWQRGGHAAWVARRQAEARQVAKRLGIEPWAFLDIPTRRLKNNLGLARDTARGTIAALGIDRVWVPAYEGGHQDHDSANALASTIGDLAEVWEFAEYNFAGGQVRAQEFPRAVGDEVTLTLSAAEMAAKRDALALYPSETGNLTYVGTARECFRQQAIYEYARPPHPGRCFYQRFQWVPFRHPRIDFTTPTEVCATLKQFLREVAIPLKSPA